MFATILTGVSIAGEDVSAIELYVAARQAVIEQQADNSGHGDVKIHGRYPIVTVRLEISPELADFTPAFEIVIWIPAFFERDYFGELTKEQRECSFCSHDTNGHVMFVQNKDITAQSEIAVCGDHDF